ncbi:DUF2147 domain-containing protein [Flavobacterium jejuense]|nr:DUF2147 domain-containing protein [Flavobacterium jejuense]
MKKTAFFTLLIVTLSSLVFTSFRLLKNPADAITGTWLTAGDDNAKVEIYESHSKYYGKIVWLKNPIREGKKALDVNNPDKNKRNNPIIGLQIISGFEFNADDNIWENGKIYDPQSGKTYSCNIRKEGNKLKVRGYIGFSLLGRTEIWTKTD